MKPLILVLALALLGASCWTQTVNLNSTTINENGNTNAVACAPAEGNPSYAGQDGKNALELLQGKYQVDVTAEGFVNAIDGEKPSDRQFWAFYVNCKTAEVGAKDLQTKTSDVVEWKLESF